MEQADWQAQLTGTIAGQVRRYRQERNMSAQKLADRCAELGVPVPRAVIANLENGYRESVTVAELLVLAAALEISPAELVFPFGDSTVAELLPDVRATLLDAAKWLGGFARIDPFDMTVAVPRAGTPLETAVQLYDSHRDAVAALLLTLSNRARARSKGEDHGAIMESAPIEERIRRIRTEMRRRGLPPPPMDAEISYVDPGEEGGGNGAH